MYGSSRTRASFRPAAPIQKTGSPARRTPDFHRLAPRKIPIGECAGASAPSTIPTATCWHDVPDKVSKVGFTVTPSPNVDAPIINEYPLTLECKVVSWGDGVLVGEVVNMSADERILTDGKVDLGKLQPIVFDAASMSYRSIGDIVGKAWGDGKKFAE